MTGHHPARRAALALLGGLTLLPPQAAWAALWGPPRWSELKQSIRQRYPEVPQLTVDDLRVALQDPGRSKPLLLDVRPAEEFDDGHLDGAMRVDSVDDAQRLLKARPPGQTAVLMCSVGLRSAAMAQTLLQRGVPSVVNLEGSVFEWANAGLPVVGSRGITGKVHPYNRRWGALLRRDLWSRDP